MKYLFVVFLTGCGWMGRLGGSGDGVSIEPPPAAKGDIPFVFANSTDRPVCTVQIDPQGGPPAGNWLKGGVTKGGNAYRTHVRAGAYHVVIDSCEKGKYHFEGDMTVSRSTSLTLTYQKYVDDRRMAPDPNVDEIDALVETPDYILHPPACVANEQPTQYNGADCCAAAYHTNPATGVRVCGA